MENGSEKASTTKVTAVMPRRSGAAVRHKTPFSPSEFVYQRNRCSIPNHCPLLLLSSDPAVRGRRGKPRLYRKFGMKNAVGKFGMKNASNSWALTPAELRKLRSLKTPHGIQRLLDDMPYHLADSAWSPRRVLSENTSHCYEGALFAAAALRVIGYPPLILDLEAEHDTDHVIAVYRNRADGHWGAVAKSNYTGCRYREPVYRSLRELAMSYFNLYFNLRRERTLRTFSRPVNLARFDRLNWMTTDKPVWFIAEHLCEIPHTRLVTPAMEKNLTRLDWRSVRAEMTGH